LFHFSHGIARDWTARGRPHELSLQIDDHTYEHDVVIDRGEIRDRKKKPSKKFRDEFEHTPLSVEEDIPWKCAGLVIGTGAYGSLLVMKEVKRECLPRSPFWPSGPCWDARGFGKVTRCF
jgi:hypothetical protein